MSKKLAIVGLVFFSVISAHAAPSAGTAAAASPNIELGRSKEAAEIDAKARKEEREANDIKEKNEKCSKQVSAVTKAKGKFLTYCKSEEKTNIKNCSDRIAECAETRRDEMPFTALTTMMNMPAIPGAGASEGSCSKYTTDKLDSLIEKAKTGLDKKQEKELEAAKKQSEEEEKYSDTRQKKNDEWLKQQEDKAADELKSKEDERNQQAAFQKQQQEYQAKLRQLEGDIFTIQKAQQLLLKRRQVDIAGYDKMMLAAKIKCNAEVKKSLASIDPNYKNSGSFSGAQSKQKTLRDLYAGCLDQETAKRTTDAEQFKVDMEKFDHQIADKTAEIQAVRQSLDSLTSMFNQAAADTANKKQKDEDAFMKKQAAKYQEILTLDDQMTKKRLATAQQIAKTKADTQQASNELMTLQNQDPIGDKSPQEVNRDLLPDFTSALDEYKGMNCPTPNFPSADDLEKGAKSSSKGSNSSSSTGGTR